jgi:hypothetical protein
MFTYFMQIIVAFLRSGSGLAGKSRVLKIMDTIKLNPEVISRIGGDVNCAAFVQKVIEGYMQKEKPRICGASSLLYFYQLML